VTHAQQEFVKERQRRRIQLEQGRAALEERTLRLKDIEKAFQVVAKRIFYGVSRSLLGCTSQALKTLRQSFKGTVPKDY
jgi:hypothetical protein